MWTILNKELRSFFSSAAGYLIVGIYIISAGLFLWILSGEYNILDSGYSSLDGLFLLSPWLFLFLVPAITMKMFAEEKRTGTIELLFTYPIHKYKIILGKYLATILLGVCALIPTLVYFYSVYHMGETVGNMDVGATWGSYIGLLLVFAVFSAIGIFASALSNNQMVSFITAAVLCFTLYFGLNLAGDLFSNATQYSMEGWSIFDHYESLSRGVLDSRDLAYFGIIITLFLFLTYWVLLRKTPYSKLKVGKQIGILVVGLIVLSFLSKMHTFRMDLTLEKRYTLSKQTKNLLKNMDGTLTVNVYLDGELNPGFRKLQDATKDLLEECSYYYSGKIAIRYMDPTRMVTTDKSKTLADILEEKKVAGVEVNERTQDGAHIRRTVYPWISFTYKGNEKKVNILNNDPSKNGSENLNTSMRDLEYKVTDVLRRLSATEVQSIAFLEGQGELYEAEVEDISLALSEYYRIDRGAITNNVEMLKPYQLLIIAGPVKTFKESEKYILDQYLMQGGKILWLIDGSTLSLDSLQKSPTNFAGANNIKINELLFHYGVRVNFDLIEDAQCISIPMNTAPVGENPKYEPMPWYFSPLLFPNQQHVIGKNIEPIKGNFVSSLSIVGNNPLVVKSILLSTSNACRKHELPSIIDLGMSAKGVDPQYFNQQNLPVSVLLEGTFTSAYTNRLVPDSVQLTGSALMKSKPTKMIVISDADIIRNKLTLKNNEYVPLPLGYDEYMNQTFGNKKFILNAVNYLCDDEGWMQLRSREISLRLLSKKETVEQRTFWQVVNIVIPLLVLILGGILYVFLRRK